MNESYIEVGNGHLTFVGPDATQLLAAASLRTAIGFYIKTKMQVSRTYTPTAMRAAATKITGKPYKRTEMQKAADDLNAWIEAMKSALPIVDR